MKVHRSALKHGISSEDAIQAAEWSLWIEPLDEDGPPRRELRLGFDTEAQAAGDGGTHPRERRRDGHSRDAGSQEVPRPTAVMTEIGPRTARSAFPTPTSALPLGAGVVWGWSQPWVTSGGLSVVCVMLSAADQPNSQT